MRCDRRRTQGPRPVSPAAGACPPGPAQPGFSRHATSDVGYRGVAGFVGLTPVADDAGRSPAGTTAHTVCVHQPESPGLS